MNSKMMKIIIGLFIVILASSCGKDYTCKCTATTTTTKAGSNPETYKLETSNSDKYRKRETARLMCENAGTTSSSPSATSITTCTLQ